MSASQVIRAIFPVDRSRTSDEWYTPNDIMILVRQVLKTISLDPCSSVEANKVVKAKKFYTIEDDGLSKDWYGKVWMNPPRGIDERISIQSVWCERLVNEYIQGNVTEALFIIRAVIGYDWFENIWNKCPNVCFLSKRPQYYRGSVGNIAGADQITGAIFYLGNNVKKFQKVFKGRGHIFDGLSYR